ncbi:MAG: beta-lactamase family protein [Clostridia bacterium]|nr:beta-lactamase family protein [Clostridia bacterium]
MDFSNVKNFMDKLSREKVPGNAVEIYLGGKKVFSYSSGYSNLENKTRMTGNEHLFIYSCSKLTTITAAMQLLERGEILATDPLYDYIPEYREMYINRGGGELEKAKNPILIKHLFNMTAGLSYNMNTDAFKKARELTGGRMNTDVVARCIASDPLSFEPGTRWQYSLCHDVLAGLVSIISGKPFRDYVKENIFEPLGMNDSYYHVNEKILSNMAEQYSFVPKGQDTNFDIVEAQKYGKTNEGTIVNVGKRNSHIHGEEYDSGGAGIITTVGDYALLTAALAGYGKGINGERILSKGSVELMRTNTLGEEQIKNFNWTQVCGYGYGYGVRTLIDKARAGSIGNVGEFGWGGAAGATALVDPEAGLGVFYAHHMLNPREEYYQPRLRNVIYSCL